MFSNCKPVINKPYAWLTLIYIQPHRTNQFLYANPKVAHYRKCLKWSAHKQPMQTTIWGARHATFRIMRNDSRGTHHRIWRLIQRWAICRWYSRVSLFARRKCYIQMMAWTWHLNAGHARDPAMVLGACANCLHTTAWLRYGLRIPHWLLEDIHHLLRAENVSSWNKSIVHYLQNGLSGRPLFYLATQFVFSVVWFRRKALLHKDSVVVNQPCCVSPKTTGCAVSGCLAVRFSAGLGSLRRDCCTEDV